MREVLTRTSVRTEGFYGHVHPFASFYKENPPFNTHTLYTLTNGVIHCVLHSEIGPALIAHGQKYYYLHGKSYSFDEWFERLSVKQQIMALYNPDNF